MAALQMLKDSQTEKAVPVVVAPGPFWVISITPLSCNLNAPALQETLKQQLEHEKTMAEARVNDLWSKVCHTIHSLHVCPSGPLIPITCICGCTGEGWKG